MGAKKSGKSCLVCRRRKVRCDKIKPVCLVCVKHGSNMECQYEEFRKNIKFVAMKTTKTPSGVITKKLHSFPNSVNENNVAKELDGLKERIQSLESLLRATNDDHDDFKEHTAASSYSSINMVSTENTYKSNDYECYGGLNFYNDLETVDVRGGRLSFIGALNYISLSKVDPYLMTITTLIRKNHDERSNKVAYKDIKKRKYSNLEYIPEVAKEVFVVRKDDIKNAINGMIEIENDSNVEAENNSQTDQQANPKGENVDKTCDTDFAQKYLENESLDGIINRGRRDKVSIVDILNSTEESGATLNNVSTEVLDKFNTKSNQDSMSLWKQLKLVAAHLKDAPQDLPASMLYQGDSIVSNGHEEIEVLFYIKKFLPPARLIWIHLDNYFSSPLYALFPFSTEDWFLDIVTSILGERSDSELPPNIKLEKKLDFAKIGCIFVILRLSYLMYPSDLTHCSTEEEKYVVSHEIGTDYIEIAQSCTNLFKLLRRGVLPVLHCLLLLRIYRRFAPEEGDIADSADSNTFTGLLVQSAQSLGMNTDAEKSYQLTNFGIYLHSWRKAWYTIYFLDISESMNMGNCFTIDPDQFNTKLPTIETNNRGTIPEFFLHPELELTTVECFQKNFELSLLISDLLKVVMSKRVKTSCTAILQKIERVEISMKSEYCNSLSSLFSSPTNDCSSSVIKCNNLRIYINTQSMLLLIQLRLFIHMDNTHFQNKLLGSFDKPLQILKKCLSLYVEMEPLLILLYYHDHNDSENKLIIERIFGPKSKIIILQSCSHFFVRFQTILHVLLSRLVHLYHNFLKNPDEATRGGEHYEDIKNMVVNIINTSLDKLAFSNSITKLLSDKQFQAWRLSKGNTFLYSIFNEKDDSIFDYNSVTNTEFQRLLVMRDNAGAPILNDHLNPVSKLPRGNNFSTLNLSQFNEIYSILNSTRWSVLSPYFSESQLKEAYTYRNFRSKSHKSKKGKRHSRKAAKENSKVVPSSEFSTELVNNELMSPSNFTDSSNDCKPSVPQIKVNEIDTHWFNTILRNNNSHSSWDGENVKRRNSTKKGSPIPPHMTQSPIVIEADRNFADMSRSANIGLDEMFFTSTTLQENLLQQLQQLSEKQSLAFSEIKENEAGCNGHPRQRKKTNFNSVIDSSDLDYLLFNGDI